VVGLIVTLVEKIVKQVEINVNHVVDKKVRKEVNTQLVDQHQVHVKNISLVKANHGVKKLRV